MHSSGKASQQAQYAVCSALQKALWTLSFILRLFGISSLDYPHLSLANDLMFSINCPVLSPSLLFTMLQMNYLPLPFRPDSASMAKRFRRGWASSRNFLESLMAGDMFVWTSAHPFRFLCVLASFSFASTMMASLKPAASVMLLTIWERIVITPFVSTAIPLGTRRGNVKRMFAVVFVNLKSIWRLNVLTNGADSRPLKEMLHARPQNLLQPRKRSSPLNLLKFQHLR